MDPGAESSSFGHTMAVLAVVAATVVLVTFVVDDIRVALGIAVLGMYAVHLLGLREIRRTHSARWEAVRDLVEETTGASPTSTRVYSPSEAPGGAAAGAGTARGGPASRAGGEDGARGGSGTIWQGGAPTRDVPVPRKFALGTVALIRKEMTPGEIDEVLKVQESRPGEYFGQLAVELGHLEEDELEEILEAQEEGLFTNEEIQDARRRLKAYQREKKRKKKDG